MVICKIHLDGRIIFYMMWCVPCNLDRIGGVAYFLIGHVINKVLKVMLIIIGLIHVRFIYLEYKKLLCIDRKEFYHSVEGGLSGSSYEHVNIYLISTRGWPPSEYILQYLRSEVFGFYYTSRQKRNQMYLIIGIKHRIIINAHQKSILFVPRIY